MSKNYLDTRIGIIGGGQLGQMMLLEAKKLGFYVTVLDPTPDCPAHSLCDNHIIADFEDREAFRKLASVSDVITYEFEHINAEALLELENEGYSVYPTAKSLQIIQDKLTQKCIMAQNNLPVPDFMAISDKADMKEAGKAYGYPYMLKARTGGYDGKGNAVVHSAIDIENAYEALGGGKLKLMAEKMIDFRMETSVLACRSLNGDIAVYPVGDNRHIDSILHETLVPADISDRASKNAMKAAERVMEVFDGIGMFCVEMFITKDDEILINEIAPRPHNSGHYTIEGCVTSQFENHIRAVTGLPLGDTSLIRPTVMINLLGDIHYDGPAIVKGLYEALSLRGVSVHIYGKKISKPKRKMGHITATADTLARAKDLAERAYEYMTVESDESSIIE